MLLTLTGIVNILSKIHIWLLFFHVLYTLSVTDMWVSCWIVSIKMSYEIELLGMNNVGVHLVQSLLFIVLLIKQIKLKAGLF